MDTDDVIRNLFHSASIGSLFYGVLWFLFPIFPFNELFSISLVVFLALFIIIVTFDIGLKLFSKKEILVIAPKSEGE